MKNLLLVFHILLIFSIVGCADKGVYVGEKKDGQPQGQGTLTFSSGKTFVGEFKDGDFHGGTATYPDGRKYEGEWKDWRYHGQGTETFPDGSKYVGEYKRGKKQGLGTMTNKDGSKFDGEWERNKPFNGKGVLIRGPDRMEGEWKNGRMEGFGKMSNNSTKVWYKSYEGEFKKGKFYGQGKMTAKKMSDDMGRSTRLAKLKGLIFKGEFKNGRPWNVKSFNDSGEQQSIIFLNGKIAGHK